jgi:Pyridoxamine 5'-phosphate oxidase
MHWKTFREEAPEVARLAQERFARSGVALLGTLRRDGSPRISPVEPLLTPEDLLLGLMWRSTKALDLLRDPRCTLHSAITSLEGTEGEIKLDGHATEAADPVVAAEHQRILRAHWGADAPTTFHVVALDIERAAFITYDLASSEMLVTRWDPARGVHETRRPYP